MFAAAAGLQQQSKDEAFMVTDGTKVEVKHFALGKLNFAYGSNGLAKERLSTTVLGLLRGKISAAELPRADDGGTSCPGSCSDVRPPSTTDIQLIGVYRRSGPCRETELVRI